VVAHCHSHSAVSVRITAVRTQKPGPQGSTAANGGRMGGPRGALGQFGEKVEAGRGGGTSMEVSDLTPPPQLPPTPPPSMSSLMQQHPNNPTPDGSMSCHHSVGQGAPWPGVAYQLRPFMNSRTLRFTSTANGVPTGTSPPPCVFFTRPLGGGA